MRNSKTETATFVFICSFLFSLLLLTPHQLCAFLSTYAEVEKKVEKQVFSISFSFHDYRCETGSSLIKKKGRKTNMQKKKKDTAVNNFSFPVFGLV